MVLLNKVVKHKSFGNGRITNFDGNYITVLFNNGEKKFIYPNAFNGYLTTADSEMAKHIQEALTIIEAESIQVHREQEIESQRKYDSLITRTKNSRKTYTRANIAFKCNFCDGGQSNEQVGFSGVCSDDLIHNNIIIEHRTWCSSSDSPCLHYLNKEISRTELDDKCKDNGFVCYESQMLRDWKALAGIVQHGDNKSKPMKLNQAQANSLCVLTTRDPKSIEKKRYIFAVFLVDESYEGDGQEEGYVSTNSKYKIKLSPTEARKLLFWNYHANSNKPEKIVWSSGLHRYFDDEQAAKILRDIAQIKIGTPSEQLAKDFYHYFCTTNRVNIDLLGAADGALTRLIV